MTVAVSAAAVVVGGCCPSHVSSPQWVNTIPLEAATLPSDVQDVIPLFRDRGETIVAGSRHRDGVVNPSGITDWVRLSYFAVWGLPEVNVDVRLYETEEAARADFFHDVGADPYYKSVVRGRPGDLCAVSNWVWARNACVPQCAYDTPTSFVLFQKGKLNVFITETSADTRSCRKDKVIAGLADVLGGREFVRPGRPSCAMAIGGGVRQN